MMVRAAFALVLMASLAGLAGAQEAAEPAPEEPAPKPVAAPASRRKTIVERVAAVVNETVILESEVAQAAAPQLGQLEEIEDLRQRQRQFQAILREALETMVNDELILQAAEEAKLEVTDDEIDKAMNEVKRNNKLTDKQLEQALAAQGYTVAEYRRDVRKQILRLRAQNVLVRPRVAVTDDEVRSHYDKLSGQSAAVVEVKVSHILIALEENAPDIVRKEARRRAGEMVARARAGEDFAGLAAAFSTDLETKDKGGEIGWVKRGELPSEWDEILFSMQAGDIRGPISGPRGLHVFRVAETKKETVRGFEEVKEDLREQLYNEELQKQTKLWLDELRKKAHVEVKI